MATKKAIRAALVALDELARGEALRLAVSRGLHSESGLGPKERRYVAQAAREICRHLRKLDAFLAQAGLEPKKLIAEDRSLARLLAYRLRTLREDPNVALRELALPGPRRPRSISDAALGELAAKMPHELQLPADANARRALQFSYPDWLMKRLADAIPDLDAWLEASARAPELDLRVNVAKAKPEDVCVELEQAGLRVKPGRFLPEALICEDRALLFDLPAFKQGRVEVQDEASQLIARLCEPARGVKVLDACAGAGGKSLALAAQGAQVVATDAIRKRLEPLRERRKRAGARIDIVDALPDAQFDAVLVDAPCSGLGALAREPDAKWRLSPAQLDAFPEQQLEILLGVADRVRLRGRLVYATCSPLPLEDEQVVERFCSARPEFRAVRQEHWYAHRDGTGSFFGAVIVRGR